MDYESFLNGIINARLTKEAQQASENTTREDRRVPNSSRRAFESRMKTDAAVARVAAQNMEDGKSMVNVAQTYTTSIKSQLQSIQDILTNCAYADTFSSADLANAKQDIQDRVSEILRLANNANFNGMNLMDGSAGKNSDGIVEMQAGNSPRQQKFMNLLDSSAGETPGVNSMDLNQLQSSSTMNFSDQAGAKNALDLVEKYIDRIGALEAQYSYDYKALDNLSILFEEQADIFERTADSANGSTTTPTSRSQVLAELVASSGANILSGIS